MSYSIRIERKALKDLDRISPPYNHRISEAIRNLANQPRPPSARKLAGRPAWRIRIGDYRVIYEVDDDNQAVLVVVVGPRSDVYRR